MRQQEHISRRSSIPKGDAVFAGCVLGGCGKPPMVALAQWEAKVEIEMKAVPE